MEHIRYHRGFTLVELMVVLSIIVIITTIVLSSQSSFNKTIILANTAYDIALTIRSTESLGSGGLVAGGISNAGRGVHFDTSNKNSFILFADTAGGSCVNTSPDCNPGDNGYTAATDTTLQTYTLGNGMSIKDFCALSGTTWSCANSSSSSLTSLDIVFVRPNMGAYIGNGAYSKACLTISSPQGGSRFISVLSSGQINPNAAQCP